MGATNTGDDAVKFLKTPDLGKRDDLDALRLAVGDGSSESCEVEAEGGVLACRET